MGWVTALVNSGLAEHRVDKAVTLGMRAQGGTFTSLHYAAELGYSDIVQLLLGSGQVQIGERDSDGYTALMYAAASGQHGVVDLLLHSGARYDERNSFGQTAVVLAQQGRHKRVLKVFDDFLYGWWLVADTRGCRG